mgnify:CR=1 FL=1
MKLGILGTGMIVKDLLTTINKLKIESISILGTEQTKKETTILAKQYHLDHCYYDYDEMLRSEIDTVYVALPNHLHFSFAKKALLKGKHVIMEKPITSNVKELEELKEIVKMAEVPFILKGIMTPNAARKALEAGVQGIVVSNHGGRVLDQCPATAQVLPSIVEAVGKDMKILADGGIRTGIDVFKALALGADAVLAARPFVTAVYGGAEEGVEALAEKFGAELIDTMKMCGAFSIEEISPEMIWKE